MLAGLSLLNKKNNRRRCITHEPSAIVTTDETEWSIDGISHRCCTLLSICAALLQPRDFLLHYCLRTIKWATGVLAKNKKRKRSLNSSIISVWPNCQTLFWQNEAEELPPASAAKVKEAVWGIFFFFNSRKGFCLTMKPGLISLSR